MYPSGSNLMHWVALSVLYIIFMLSFVTSAIAAYLALEWKAPLEPSHYLAFIVAVASYVAANTMRKSIFRRKQTPSLQELQS
jgi:uncharacterized integral membrane protein